MGNGRIVRCREPTADGGEITHDMDRSICVFEPKPWCPTCPNSQFEVLFQIRIGDQIVACPRWENDKDRFIDKKDPVGYVFTPRAVCLMDKPFLFCTECPNSQPGQEPRSTLKWYELEERQRRIERELDEEQNE